VPASARIVGATSTTLLGSPRLAAPRGSPAGTTSNGMCNTSSLRRSVRDRLDAAVGRESPLLAARLGVEEGRMYRELRTFVRGIEQEISDRGAVKLLAEAGQAGDEDEEVRP